MVINYKVHRLEALFQLTADDVEFETTQACPVCKSNKLIDVAVLDRSLTSSWCEDCSHLFHRKRPNSSWYCDWYNNSWDAAGKEAHAVKPGFSKRMKQKLKHKLGIFARRDVYDFCSSVTQRGSTVLDVGCGYGTDLAPFVQNGCDTYGIEASPHRSEAAARLGVQTAAVRVEELDEETFGTSFDLVFANHVLEHVIDPHKFVAAIRKVIKPYGHICISVPNFSKDLLLQQFFYALHIHCFSILSLKTLLEKNGFIVHKETTDHQIRVLAQFDPARAKKRPASGRQLEDVDAAFFIKRCFGKGLDQGDSVHPSMFFEWSRLPKPERTPERLYEINYKSVRSQPYTGSVVEISFEGERQLPMHFKNKQEEGIAAFWVK